MKAPVVVTSATVARPLNTGINDDQLLEQQLLEAFSHPRFSNTNITDGSAAVAASSSLNSLQQFQQQQFAATMRKIASASPGSSTATSTSASGTATTSVATTNTSGIGNVSAIASGGGGAGVPPASSSNVVASAVGGSALLTTGSQSQQLLLQQQQQQQQQKAGQLSGHLYFASGDITHENLKFKMFVIHLPSQFSIKYFSQIYIPISQIMMNE